MSPYHKTESQVDFSQPPSLEKKKSSPLKSHVLSHSMIIRAHDVEISHQSVIEKKVPHDTRVNKVEISRRET